MPLETKAIFEFGSFRLNPAERLLLRDQAQVRLPPKAFDALVVLVENRGHLLEKDELLRKVWPDTFVEESNLAQHISVLRKALQDGEDGPRISKPSQRVAIASLGRFGKLAASHRIPPFCQVQRPAHNRLLRSLKAEFLKASVPGIASRLRPMPLPHSRSY